MDYLATGEVTLTELVSMLRNVYTLFATTQVSWLTAPRNGHDRRSLPLCVCVPRGLQQGSPLHARPQSGHVVVWISGGALFRINRWVLSFSVRERLVGPLRLYPRYRSGNVTWLEST